MILALCIAVVLTPTSVRATVNQIIREARAERPMAGVGVALARGGRIIFAEGYGFADLENQVPADSRTVFHTCSIGKHMTAAAVLRLATDGKLALSDDLGKYIPQFAGRNITLRQALSPTSR